MPPLPNQEHLRANNSPEQLLRAPGDRAGSGPVQPTNTGLMTQLSLPFLFATPPKKKYDLFCHSRMPETSDSQHASGGEQQSRGPAVEKNAMSDEVRPLQASEMGLALRRRT